MDGKTKELVHLVSAFCSENLNVEYKRLCIRVIESLESENVSFKRGKIENWASGIIYAVGQVNFLFDDSFVPYVSADEICNYFNTKKSTTSNKARDIRKMLDMEVGDERFSTYIVLNSNVCGVDLGRIKTLQGAKTDMTLNHAVEMLKMIHKKMR